MRTERPSGLETGGVRRELARALDVWAKNSKLTFHEINSDAADILISFHRGYHGDGYPFDGRGQILAHAFFPGSDRGGDAHFDEEEEWTLDSSGNDDGTSLFAVAAHEFGHSLGLAHSSVRGALMYPWYQGITEDYELPEDDKHGIQQMYGAPESRLWGKNPDYPGYRPPVHRPSYPTYTPRTTTTTTTTTSTTTTERPWRTRPREPMNHPPDRRDHPYRPNHYPEERTRPPYYPPRPEWPVTPRRPHRHHTPPTVGTTSTPYTTSTTPSSRYRPPVKKDLPDKCDTDYDAISLIRRELFIFKGKYVWRLNDRGLVDGFPAEINQLFKFPMRVDHVDAVYERIEDNRIIFFIGRYFYVFKAFYLEPGYPKPLTALGLPPDLEKIDAAMVWGYNKKTYFFSGSMYWRFDENVNHVELDYPRDISMFAGVGPNIDTVFQWKNGTTYFFKGKHFWQFDDMRMRVAHKKPKSSAHYWMGCPRGIETNDVDFDDVPTKARINSISASGATTSGGLVLIALTLLSLLMSQSSRAWYT
ncbi:hypothetical protein TSAR_017006 [Trichomalopsis sarcophagae]|uniref:Peptidase metallopeptidase domain-containing protein n=1 Tax=Trichomalopsis sarcophagae TaxID=543379 RepID=A0A232FLF0_9HYME|nr:hypothetical protein TSAR_017006 [Trichomalopsis sarcophagae]